MIELKIKFTSSDQILHFCDKCQEMKSDIDVTELTNRNRVIDGKSLLGLMSIELGRTMRLLIDGDDEEKARELFAEYETE